VVVGQLLAIALTAPPRRNTKPKTAYEIGVGISDITGPAAQIVFMGYAVSQQQGQGIHFRQRARAFVISDGAKRVAYVSGDFCMGGDLVTRYVVRGLDERLGRGVYTHDNVCLSATHTHSTPGGFEQYVMTQVPTLGFVKQAFEAIVSGIVDAIVKAHHSLQPGSVKFARGSLTGANINRSPTSYLLNPQSERDEYASIGDTDKDMLLLRFDAADGTPLGMLNWFAVHGTSMNNTNKLISGDNRGRASMLFEQKMNGDALPGFGPFVAAFAATNLGDVSPNTAGPRCLDTGLPCDGKTSTCNGRNEMCAAFGPGKNGDMTESTDIIATKQFKKALELYESATTEITGPIDFRHSFVEMHGLPIQLANGTVVKGCGAALGESFAAGTTDGPGQFDFTQGSKSLNPFWKVVSSFLSKPTQEQVDCHAPKPILLNLESLTEPYRWEAPNMPVQVFQIGNLITLNTPNEMTTMSGRRLRKAISKIFQDSKLMDGKDVQVVIGGLANSYSHYVATFEEYQAQRYEAASTLYGPHTLSGYIQEFSRLSKDLIEGRNSSTGEAPPDLLPKQMSLKPGVIFDDKPLANHFGQVLEDAKGPYTAGSSIVSITYQGANPRNNLRLQDTFLTVELAAGNTWKAVASDSNWETKFHWKSTDLVAARSEARAEWAIPTNTTLGTYRICYHGDWKSGWSGKITAFTGCSSNFTVNKGIDVFV
jgi:neutral ceramidase